MEIRFITSNKHKIKEVNDILNKLGYRVTASEIKIEELQTENVLHLVHDKVLKAFAKTGRPTMVEHTGLYIDSLNGFPGGLTQIFWDTLQADNFSALLGTGANTKVVAKTVIGYCDGRKIHYFEGEVDGNIAPVPKGPKDFQWDCVFVPQGYAETFAELGDKKNEISMRKLALDEFARYLESERR